MYGVYASDFYVSLYVSVLRMYFAGGGVGGMGKEEELVMSDPNQK